jgi:hypothetical protein
VGTSAGLRGLVGLGSAKKPIAVVSDRYMRCCGESDKLIRISRPSLTFSNTSLRHLAIN